MAKKSNRRDYENAKKAADYYDLKTQAVDDLVNTNVTNAPKVSEAERRKYRTRSRFNFPMWVKVLLLKWWLAGIVCYFFVFGLAVSDALDQVVILSVALGVVTDLITNNLIRYMAQPQGSNEKWLMVPPWRFVSLFVNILYALALCLLTYKTYTAVNAFFAQWTHDERNPLFNVEPVTFGLVILGWDLALTGIKRVLTSVFRDAMDRASR